MKITKWKKLKSKMTYNGTHRKVLTETFLLPDGRKSDYESLTQGNSVGIFAINTKGEFLLTKQFRPGPEKILYSLPAGMVEKNMSPLATAKKELLEETGYSAKNFKLFSKVPKDGYSKDFHYIFTCSQPKFEGYIENDTDEWIDSKFYSPSEIDKIVKSGQAGTSLSLFWLGYRMKK